MVGDGTARLRPQRSLEQRINVRGGGRAVHHLVVGRRGPIVTDHPLALWFLGKFPRELELWLAPRAPPRVDALGPPEHDYVTLVVLYARRELVQQEQRTIAADRGDRGGARRDA